ncbi:MAG: MarR family transcriptional regulator [Deltaproteobacteria bacterium]|nr:MarR family transcriptional regulator [Deltaproteobacteria bacterium]MBW2639344.1 MarR family transcriptional regulator [Deltaproteobacteria bacterium]MBW2681520.1 MarR family transcriptional regulator [Deltaproteobacteria bacterium]
MSTDNSGNLNTINKIFPSDHTRQIIYSIRRLIQASELYTKELNKKYQVSAAQLNCILTLYEYGPLPPSKIANHMMVKSSTITGVVDRLEKKGLAERMRNSPDRRVITIQLTEAGEKLAQNAPPPIQQKIIDGLKQTETAKKEQIVRSLNVLTDMLDIQDLEVK